MVRSHTTLPSLRKQHKIISALEALGFEDEETLFAAVGYGQVTLGQVLSHLVPQPAEVAGQTADEIDLEKFRHKLPGGDSSGVKVGGIGNVLIRLGRCCNPLPGERILGVITRGKGVTVHTIACQRLLESDPQRHIAVSWDAATDYTRPVKIEVLSEDRTGLLANMSKAISTAGLNIASANVRTLTDERALNVFEVLVSSSDDLQRVMRNLERVRGVVKVSRMKP